MAFDMAAGVFYNASVVLGFAILDTPAATDDDTEVRKQPIIEEGQYEFQMGRALYFMAGSNIPIKNTLFENTTAP